MISSTVRWLVIGLRLLPLAAFALVAVPIQILLVKLRAPLSRRLPVWFHRLACLVIGLRVHTSGEMCGERPLLITANHSSWLDICVISALGPVCFIAKSEVAGWPLIGTFARAQRTVFVDRGKRSATGMTVAEIGERLADGDAMVLFAEGTSSDGNRVLPFRSALIGAVREAIRMAGGEKVVIQPTAIAYVRRNGLPTGRAEQPRLSWYGDMDLAPHLLDIVAGGPIDAAVRFERPVHADAATDRKTLARDLESVVRKARLEIRNFRD